MMYTGDVLEDLKRMGYLLSALARGEKHPNTKHEIERFADASNHALQILDSNRGIIVEYEQKTKTGVHV